MLSDRYRPELLIAASRTRKSAKGATRKSSAPAPRQRWSFAWLNRLLILLGVCTVATAGVKAYLVLQAIPVQHITVTGELANTQADAVQEMVQSSLEGGFLKADLQKMRLQLEGLPWIYRATVRRRWPNALEVHVLEQLPIARWGDDGFLNHEGGIFGSDRGGDWQALPLLAGPDGSAPALVAKYQRLVELLAPLGLKVETLSLDESGELAASLGGGMQLIVGSEHFLSRMRRFVSVYKRELVDHRTEIERVDLRYESGLAVAFTETSQVAGL